MVRLSLVNTANRIRYGRKHKVMHKLEIELGSPGANPNAIAFPISLDADDNHS